MKIGKKLGLVILVLALAFVFASLVITEKSYLAERIAGRKFEAEKLRNLLPGDWSAACTIDELGRPVAIAESIAPGPLKFNPVGNQQREILLDGASGVVLVDTNRDQYALYLVFDANRIKIIQREGNQCVPFESALLRRFNAGEANWHYFELEQGTQP